MFIKKLSLYLLISLSFFTLKPGFYDVKVQIKESNGHQDIVILCFDNHICGTQEENLNQAEFLRTFLEEIRRNRSSETLEIKLLLESYVIDIPEDKKDFVLQKDRVSYFTKLELDQNVYDFFNLNTSTPLDFFGGPYCSFDDEDIKIECIEGRQEFQAFRSDFANCSDLGLEVAVNLFLKKIKKCLFDLMDYYISESGEDLKLKSVFLYLRKLLGLFLNLKLFRSDDLLKSFILNYISDETLPLCYKFMDNKVVLEFNSSTGSVLDSSQFVCKETFLDQDLAGLDFIDHWIIEANILWKILSNKDLNKDRIFVVCAGGDHCVNTFKILQHLGFSELNNLELEQGEYLDEILFYPEELKELLIQVANRFNIEDIPLFDFLIEDTCRSFDLNIIRSFLIDDYQHDSFKKLFAALALIREHSENPETLGILRGFLNKQDTNEVVKRMVFDALFDTSPSTYDSDKKNYIMSLVGSGIKSLKLIKKWISNLLHQQKFELIDKIFADEEDLNGMNGLLKAKIIKKIIYHDYVNLYKRKISSFLESIFVNVEHKLSVVECLVLNGKYSIFENKIDPIFEQTDLDLGEILNNFISVLQTESDYNFKSVKQFIKNFIKSTHVKMEYKINLLERMLSYHPDLLIHFMNEVVYLIYNSDAELLTKVYLFGIIREHDKLYSLFDSTYNHFNNFRKRNYPSGDVCVSKMKKFL